MTKAVRHDCEILWNVKQFGMKEYQDVRRGVRGEDRKQVNVSVGYCSLTNHAKWSGLNNMYL